MGLVAGSVSELAKKLADTVFLISYWNKYFCTCLSGGQFPMDMTRENDDFDNPWKKIIEKYFQDFILLFFPKIHAEIDWQRGYDFIDQEFQQIVRDADLKKRYSASLSSRTKSPS
jgi:hypothetical protein